MDDTVQIRCSRCKGVFRDRAGRVQSGYSRQCPGCEVVLFFEETSNDRNIKRALVDARVLRQKLRDPEETRRRHRPGAFWDPGPEAGMTEQRWTEVLRCPSCALAGVASLSQRSDGLVVVDRLPDGFKAMTSKYGDTFCCTACQRAAGSDTR